MVLLYFKKRGGERKRILRSVVLLAVTPTDFIDFRIEYVATVQHQIEMEFWRRGGININRRRRRGKI